VRWRRCFGTSACDVTCVWRPEPPGPRGTVRVMPVFYVFKLGPLPTGEGPTTFYVGMRDGWLAPPAVGKKLGFSSAPIPDWVEPVRCGLAVGLGLGPRSGTKSLLALYELAKGAAKFWEARVWEHCHSDQPIDIAMTTPKKVAFEGSILGNGGAELGLLR
jgi:hypothetical protein